MEMSILNKRKTTLIIEGVSVLIACKANALNTPSEMNTERTTAETIARATNTLRIVFIEVPLVNFQLALMDSMGPMF